MKRLGWHSMSLSRRVLLLLTLVLVSAAVQISIAQIQNLHVFRPMEENAEQIQTISQFLHETEKCIGTLEEYHWEYGDPDALGPSFLPEVPGRGGEREHPPAVPRGADDLSLLCGTAG